MSGPPSAFMAAALAGTVGLWLMLPRASAAGRAIGTVLTAIAAGILFALLPPLGDWIAQATFYVIAGATVVAAAATVTVRNPVYAAVWFGMTLLGTAGLFLFQGSQFLAVATVVVYAGAILVTFLFVLMLAHPRGRAAYDRTSWEALVSAASGAVMVGILSMTVTGVLTTTGAPQPAPAIEREDRVLGPQHVAQVGAEMTGRHMIAVEVAGTLLLAALVGAAVIVGKSPPHTPAGKSPLPRSAEREDAPS